MSNNYKLKNETKDKSWKNEDKVLMKKLLKIVQRNDPAEKISTLMSQNSDDLDFHDIAIWNLRNMLKEAYALGKKEALE